jgi:hypothetical protein
MVLDVTVDVRGTRERSFAMKRFVPPCRVSLSRSSRSARLAAVVCLLAASSSVARAGVPLGPVAATLTGQGEYGSIKGRLVYGGDQAPTPKVLVEVGQASKDPTVCAATKAITNRDLVVDPSTKGVKFAFAYLVRPKGTNPDALKALVEKTPVVELDQKNCEFLPYSLAIVQDQAVKFKSSDPVNHNIHISPFTNAPFNQILPPNGEVEKKFVAERRVIPLTCDIHPWMKGWIMVLDHPFFAITSDDGSFEIKGVPAGEQNLILWQAAVGYANPGLARGMPVKVEAGKATDIGDVKLDPAKVK